MFNELKNITDKNIAKMSTFFNQKFDFTLYKEYDRGIEVADSGWVVFPTYKNASYTPIPSGGFIDLYSNFKFTFDGLNIPEEHLKNISYEFFVDGGVLTPAPIAKYKVYQWGDYRSHIEISVNNGAITEDGDSSWKNSPVWAKTFTQDSYPYSYRFWIREYIITEYDYEMVLDDPPNPEPPEWEQTYHRENIEQRNYIFRAIDTLTDTIVGGNAWVETTTYTGGVADEDITAEFQQVTMNTTPEGGGDEEIFELNSQYSYKHYLIGLGYVTMSGPAEGYNQISTTGFFDNDGFWSMNREQGDGVEAVISNYEFFPNSAKSPYSDYIFKVPPEMPLSIIQYIGRTGTYRLSEIVSTGIELGASTNFFYKKPNNDYGIITNGVACFSNSTYKSRVWDEGFYQTTYTYSTTITDTETGAGYIGDEQFTKSRPYQIYVKDVIDSDVKIRCKIYWNHTINDNIIINRVQK